MVSLHIFILSPLRRPKPLQRMAMDVVTETHATIEVLNHNFKNRNKNE